MIRGLAVVICCMFSYCSFSQAPVRGADTCCRPIRPDSLKMGRRIDSVRGSVRIDSAFGRKRFDSSYGLVRVDSLHSIIRGDSLRGIMKWKNNNIFQFFRNAMSRGGVDSTETPTIGRHIDSVTRATVLNTKSEIPFKPYEGKIIRRILVRGYGFEQTFTDTSKRLQYFGTRLLNSLHHKTRDWVIRNSLFIRERTPVNAYKLADNERLIRSLQFVQDARILVNYLPDNEDSVDVVVIVKDVFSIGGAVDAFNFSPVQIRGNISDANAFGMGQRVQLGIFQEQNRRPNSGYELYYSKANMGRTFTNGTAVFSQIRGDLFDGTPDEQAWQFKLDRPLYSPYAHLAGDVTVGGSESFNRYSKPDSVFYKYQYRTIDTWLGWNLGSERFLANTSVLDRRFLGIRYFQNHFYEVPRQIGDKFNFRFNDREAVLGQFTFFRQEFYKTNYIYGFGATEDVPEGYNIAFTGGWYRQLDLKRAYAGVEANSYVATDKGDFIQYFMRSGTFFRKGRLEDASFLIGSSVYSRLFLLNRLKIRQYFNFSYTRQFNRVGIDPLTINNVFGLRYFSGDSTFGYQRITFHSETSLFLNYRLLGFKFAPFAFGDLSLLTPEQESFRKSSLYHGLGAGIRTRNENLVFQTIELRFAYFPRKTEQNSSFKIMLNTGIQFRYNSSYVRAPDVVYLNNDGLNSIY